MEEIYLTVTKEDWLRGYNIDVSNHIEITFKGLKYLSWSYAEMYLRTNFQNLVVDFERTFEDNSWSYIFGNERNGYFCLPYIVDVKSNLKTTKLYYPIIDQSNKAILNPNAMQINTSLQRARTKIIALTTGIGFSLYNGEDIKEIISEKVEKVKIEKEQVKKTILEKLKTELDECQSIEVYDSIMNRWRNAFGKIKDSDYKAGLILLENKKNELENNE